MTRMNEREAKEKARKLWGETAFAVCNDMIVKRQCRVGIVLNGHMPHVRGTGPNWEMAFKDAEYSIN